MALSNENTIQYIASKTAVFFEGIERAKSLKSIFEEVMLPVSLEELNSVKHQCHQIYRNKYRKRFGLSLFYKSANNINILVTAIKNYGETNVFFSEPTSTRVDFSFTIEIPVASSYKLNLEKIPDGLCICHIAACFFKTGSIFFSENTLIFKITDRLIIQNKVLPFLEEHVISWKCKENPLLKLKEQGEEAFHKFENLRIFNKIQFVAFSSLFLVLPSTYYDQIEQTQLFQLFNDYNWEKPTGISTDIKIIKFIALKFLLSCFTGEDTRFLLSKLHLNNYLFDVVVFPLATLLVDPKEGTTENFFRTLVELFGNLSGFLFDNKGSLRLSQSPLVVGKVTMKPSRIFQLTFEEKFFQRGFYRYNFDSYKNISPYLPLSKLREGLEKLKFFQPLINTEKQILLGKLWAILLTQIIAEKWEDENIQFFFECLASFLGKLLGLEFIYFYNKNPTVNPSSFLDAIIDEAFLFSYYTEIHPSTNTESERKDSNESFKGVKLFLNSYASIAEIKSVFYSYNSVLEGKSVEFVDYKEKAKKLNRLYDRFKYLIKEYLKSESLFPYLRKYGLKARAVYKEIGIASFIQMLPPIWSDLVQMNNSSLATDPLLTAFLRASSDWPDEHPFSARYVDSLTAFVKSVRILLTFRCIVNQMHSLDLSEREAYLSLFLEYSPNFVKKKKRTN